MTHQPAALRREKRRVHSDRDPETVTLVDKSLGVVQATAPVVAAHADEITAHFYPRMFAAHPELLRVFNQGNQATGEQSKSPRRLGRRVRRATDRS